MPSNTYIQSLCMISNSELPLELVELNHATLASPICFVKDNKAIVSNNKTYNPCGFSIVYPDAGENQQPKASMQIDNINPEICKMIDERGGLRGATLTILHVMKQTSNIIEFKQVFKYINNISITNKILSFDLGYTNVLNTQAVQYYYRPELAEGLF